MCVCVCVCVCECVYLEFYKEHFYKQHSEGELLTWRK